ncbi:hypothetical protein GCM10017044_27710 [Kordiimonas sediminis]|uniref:Stringent starvation protein B n=1 Tax=Kordiimonas sediminis TaxID=1735581 RepID=A0A919AY54_9PROT|nr:ClpXP protease specificity-enhancing factor SspB [Kordiimonas sediminis]GHF30781.1 hypothetical protein GCM10017044_27710 [Kordiimonas sediminis]
MTDVHIDYDAKVQQALRQVVRNVLLETEKDGLKGDHHFYIAFKSQAPGVELPAHLLSRFPEEMTIVIQHKFWGLKIHEDRFEIGLSFNQKPEHLVIPFDSVVGFVDPSVQFALQFHDDEGEEPITEMMEANVDFADSGTVQFEDDDDMDDMNDDTDPDDSGDKGDTNNVVTLDAFRKK